MHIHKLFLPLISSLFIASCFFDSNKEFGLFVYQQADDFYSVIYKKSQTSNEYSEVVVPYGVFSVIEHSGWLDVARMDVSIINCVREDGLKDERTSYNDKLEYWSIDINGEIVSGPMTEEEYRLFSEQKELTVEVRSMPNKYRNYLNDIVDCS